MLHRERQPLFVVPEPPLSWQQDLPLTPASTHRCGRAARRGERDRTGDVLLQTLRMVAVRVARQRVGGPVLCELAPPVHVEVDGQAARVPPLLRNEAARAQRVPGQLPAVRATQR